MVEKIAYTVTHKPKLVFITALLLLIPSLIGLVATRINYDILEYLPADLDSVKGEKILEEPFQMAATTMLVVENMPPDYTDRLQREIAEIPGVHRALWVPGIVGIQLPEEMIPEAMRDVFYGDNATMMIIQYDLPAGSDETMNAIGEIRRICNKNCFTAGMSAMAKDLKDLVIEEIPMYVLLAVATAYVVMSLAMSSWLLPMIFLSGIGLAILYNLGTNIFIGEISYITLAITAVLQLGVTMDYSIFLYNRFREEEANCEDKRDAMERAVIAAFSAVSSSSLTTVAGFLALCFMRLLLGKDIGVVMAKGVVFGVLTVVLVLPAMLLIFDKPINRFRHPTPHFNFSGVNRFAVKHRKFFVLVFLVLLLPAYYSQANTPVYYKLDQSLPRDLPCVVGTDKLDEDFGMAGSHFIVMRDDLSYKHMSELNERLEDVVGVTSVISYSKLLGQGIPDFFLPEDVSEMLKQGGMQLLMINSEYSAATDEANAQVLEIIDLVHEYDEGAYVTGEIAMTYDLIDVTAEDLRVTSVISILAVFVIIAIAFKSLSVPLLLVAAIELAVFLNMGTQFFIEEAIPFVAPTVISCVQLGATVDYSILLATRFQEELKNGFDREEAIFVASKTATPSILLSSMILLTACLAVGMYSRIGMIGSICTMLARGSFISALISIFITPSLLCVFEPLINKTSLWWRKDRQKKEKKTAGNTAEGGSAE